jgi:hypothetical protein
MRSSKWSNFSLEPPFYIVFGLQMSYLYMLEGVCTSDRPEWIIYGVACLISRRDCFDFSLHFYFKSSTLGLENGLTFDWNLRFTSFLDYKCLTDTCKKDYAQAIDPNRSSRGSYV